ncbi:MAG: DUF2029 domain-containing protein [Oligoflexales bacterium]|nr:DUF2029 domain-containing protein [Oligoflexales bacterium]
MTRKNRLIIISSISGFFMTFALIFHWYMRRLGKAWPWTGFTFDPAPAELFKDFLYIVPTHFQYLPGNPTPYRNYFPFSYTIIRFFKLIEPYSLEVALGVFLTLFTLFFIYYIWRNTRTNTDPWFAAFVTATLTLCSYPLWFTLQRGNLEGMVFIFMGLFFITYFDKKFMWSAFFLACATSMKATPGIFVLLFLSEKRYREAVLFLVFAGTLTLGSLLIMEGTLIANIRRFGRNLQIFNELYAMKGHYDYGHSLFGMISYFIEMATGTRDFSLFYKLYFLISAPIGLFIAYYLCFIEKDRFRKITLLTAIMLVLPNLSYNYKLLHIIFPLMYYINLPPAIRFDKWYCISFALLTVPKNYRYTPFQNYPGIIIDASLLIFITIIVIVSGYKEKNNAIYPEKNRLRA